MNDGNCLNNVEDDCFEFDMDDDCYRISMTLLMVKSSKKTNKQLIHHDRRNCLTDRLEFVDVFEQ